jgi:hypothetical protein
MLYGPVWYPLALAAKPAVGFACGVVKSEAVGIVERFPPMAPPYGLPPLAFALESNAGVLLDAGLAGDPALEAKLPVLEPGAAKLGLLPAKVDSEGFLDHGKILALGIFHPDWHPVCPAPTTVTNNTAKILRRVNLVDMASKSF